MNSHIEKFFDKHMMNKLRINLLLPAIFTLLSIGCSNIVRKTEISIRGESFFINGSPTLQGKEWNGHKLEGLLPNARMVQGIFDDLNPQTATRWRYPDNSKWDPERNTSEFIEAMGQWNEHGLLAFTINLQGGSPEGYSKLQPWHNSAISNEGGLREDYMNRLERIINKADDLGMVVILGIFYFGQDEHLKDETAVVNAVDNTIDWLFERNYTNVLIEINNECNIRYDHDILKPDRVHKLIERVKSKSKNGKRFLVSTSYGGGYIPRPNVVRSADYILLHGNGVHDPQRIMEMVNQIRDMAEYTPKPVIFNEDDHFDFDKPINNFLAATAAYASWGFFDYRKKGEGFNEGYQSVPVNWEISSGRKEGFFKLLQHMTKSN